jgi:beta-lactamase class D
MEAEDEVYIFATNIQSSNSAAKGTRAREITQKILQDLK